MVSIWGADSAHSGCTPTISATSPALRRLEHARGQIGSVDEVPAGTVEVSTVVAEAFDNLSNGPTWIVGEDFRAAAAMMGSLSRNDLVKLMAQASAAAMGESSGTV